VSFARSSAGFPMWLSRRTGLVGLLLLITFAGCASRANLLGLVDARNHFTPPERLSNVRAARGMSDAQLLAAYPGAGKLALGYTPSQAEHFECLQKSPFALDGEEQGVLDRQGLVLSERHTDGRSFAMLYLNAFHADLPVFISADSILHAWHRAYDELLVQTERDMLAPMLGEMLAGMRKQLSASHAKPATRAALDEYLTVAQSLLEDNLLRPAAGGSSEDVKRNFDLARSAQGNSIELFGKPRQTDLSQFKPRGHYESHPDLIPYFRAMMWLGRLDFRVFQTTPSGAQRFQRDEFEDMVLARQLMDDKAMALWGAIDQGIAAFVGMHDSATPEDVDALLAKLKAHNLQDVERLSDEVLQRSVRDSGFGSQRILGDLMGKLPDVAALPNNVAFALFGQRYTLDGHALHAVVEDRVPGRQLPTAFDVGFTVFRNNRALDLLKPELGQSSLAGALGSMRALADGQKEAYWTSSFYTLWLAALRGMSPVETDSLPKSARTDAWARRTLLTQLGSWSELRHDTILYAKQSYSTFILCKFPDAYVDPYPEVFRRLAQASDLGRALAQRLEKVSGKKLDLIRTYFEDSKKTFEMLQQMAERELEHKRLTADQLDFVNDMIVAHHSSDSGGCGGGSVYYSGWYRQLFYTADILDPDLSIADVHTSAEQGILHVGKRYPLQAVISIDDGSGPRVFTGAVYSFHQVVSGTRLTDAEWARQTPPDEPWLRSILAHARLAETR